jgi:hypothetical protein
VAEVLESLKEGCNREICEIRERGIAESAERDTLQKLTEVTKGAEALPIYGLLHALLKFWNP